MTEPLSAATIFVVTAVLFLGLSTGVWAIVGLFRRIRYATHRLRDRGAHPRPPRIAASQVAVLIAAHNEELVIGDTLRAVTTLVPGSRVFVISDASTDRTADIVRECGANVLELETSHGKAGALATGARHFELSARFQVVMILDADTVPSPYYLRTGLPLFDDPDVAAVAGRAGTRWPERAGLLARALLSHRERLYVVFQTVLKYGQAARGADAVAIVPGFASMYRTDVLDSVEIDAPGLAIEDYNMTFEVHARGLGRVAFLPWAARASTQDPATLHDYTRQVGRWNLGFWQTLRRHRPRPTVFWLSVIVYALETVVSSVLLLLLAALVIADSALATLRSMGIDWALPPLVESLIGPALAGMLLVDLAMTLYAACLTRRISIALFAPAYIFLRIIDAALCMRSLVRSASSQSTGAWRSPTRRLDPVQSAA